ncbi:MAG: hypothetical protein WAJ85_15370 [Candidatus Baltobacteraceae bacterium]
MFVVANGSGANDELQRIVLGIATDVVDDGSAEITFIDLRQDIRVEEQRHLDPFDRVNTVAGP